MSIIALILLLIAAVLFLVPEATLTRAHRSSVNLGLFFLTVGLIVQFVTKSHPILF
jgi:galactitol-specific phosphotransferase system IIC component